MRKPFLLITLGVVVAAMLLFVPGRSPGAVTAGPSPNIGGGWGLVYSVGGTTFGECIVQLKDNAGSISSVGTMDCEANSVPTATGGTLTGTLNNLSLASSIIFTGPPALNPPLKVSAPGTVALNGNSMSGTWSTVPLSSLGGTYVGAKLLNTPIGGPVVVSVPSAGATVTFATVKVAGGTTVVTDSSTAGTLPGQFQLLGDFYHVITETTFNGIINFCVSYQDKEGGVGNGFVDGTLPPLNEQTLQLLHLVGTTYVDVTAPLKRDTVNNVICGEVTSLSEFALGSTVSVGGLAVDLDGDLGDLPLETAQSSGSNAGVLAGTIAGITALAVTLGGAAWYARRRWAR